MPVGMCWSRCGCSPGQFQSRWCTDGLAPVLHEEHWTGIDGGRARHLARMFSASTTPARALCGSTCAPRKKPTREGAGSWGMRPCSRCFNACLAVLCQRDCEARVGAVLLALASPSVSGFVAESAPVSRDPVYSHHNVSSTLQQAAAALDAVACLACARCTPELDGSLSAVRIVNLRPVAFE